MKSSGILAALVCNFALLCLNTYTAAQENNERPFRIGGLLFGDFYHITSHHTDEGEGATGFVVRRVYLTFDANFSKCWFGRLRFEVNQTGEFETYDFKADFKDIYVGLNAGRHRLLFGLSPTFTYDLIESIWGLRYLARTPMDLQGVASRDNGISAKGPLSSSGALSYRIMVGSGLDFGNEAGDGWKWMGALTWKPSTIWIFDLYADYEKLPGSTDRTTLQIFIGYQTDRLRGGLQYSYQDRQDDPRLELASVFVVGQLGRRLALIGRVDRLIGASPRGDKIAYLPFDPSSRATMFIGGMEFGILKQLLITPNVVVITYDRNNEGIKPQQDVHLRVTLFLDLE